MKLIGWGLMVIGVLSLVAGFLLPGVIDRRVLDELSTTDVLMQSNGTISEVLDADALAGDPGNPYETGIIFERSLVAVSDAAASPDDVVVFDTRIVDTRADNGSELAVNSARYAFAGKDSQLVQCCDANVNGNVDIAFTGIVPLKFPFDAAAGDYQMFSPQLFGATDVRYETDVEQYGLKLRQYRQELPPTQTPAAPLNLPTGVAAALVGRFAPQLAPQIPAEGEVALYEFYSAEARYLVEPQTGWIIDTELAERTTYRLNGGDTDVVTKVAAETVGAEPGEVAAAVAGQARSLVWAERSLPIGVGIGLLGIAAGIVVVLAAGSRRSSEGGR